MHDLLMGTMAISTATMAPIVQAFSSLISRPRRSKLKLGLKPSVWAGFRKAMTWYTKLVRAKMRVFMSRLKDRMQST